VKCSSKFDFYEFSSGPNLLYSLPWTVRLSAFWEIRLWVLKSTATKPPDYRPAAGSLVNTIVLSHVTAY